MARLVLSLVALISLVGATYADAKDELFQAARKGDAKTVKSLLDKGVDVNSHTEYGATALHYACDKGHAEVVRILLEHKADVNAADTFYKATPMTWAIMNNRLEVVKLLVKAGVKGADSSLAMAAAQGNLPLVQAFLDSATFKQETLDQALANVPAAKKDVAALLTKSGAKLKPVTSNANQYAANAGTYQNDSGTTIKVAAADGKLTASFGDTPLVLTGGEKDVFKLAGNDTATATFQKKDGKVNAVVLRFGTTETIYKRVEAAAAAAPAKAHGPLLDDGFAGTIATPGNWPGFRGLHASGVADGQHPPTGWDAAAGANVRWKTPIPGLGHAGPIVWGDRIFVTTAVSGAANATLRSGQYGDVESVEDKSAHTWKLICLDKQNGKILWEQTAATGVPKIKRHLKSTQANPTPATDGHVVIAFFGSEGLYCYDFSGKLLWSKQFGVLESGWFYDKDYEWGFGSSPVIYRDKVIIQCDIGKGSFIAAYALADGKELWKTPREEVPSWGTPTIVEGPHRVELATNATKFARGYDPETGKELWRLGPNSEISVPTPLFAQGLIFITSGYRPVQPIYAVRPGATGDLTLPKDKTTSDNIAWSKTRGGPYLPSPIAYGEHLYICANSGMLTCYDAKTGKEIYKERLSGKGGFTASPVAADGRLYFTSEEGGVQVVKAGPKFELLSENPVGEICMSSPAIADGMFFLRSQHHLFAFGRKPTAAIKAEK